MKANYLIVFATMLAIVAGYLFWSGPHSATASSQSVIVLCSSCTYGGLPETGHLVLMDANSGEIWLYDDAAMEGKGKPIDWGKLVLGRPVLRHNSSETGR